MRIAYVHYLYGNDTALLHVGQFARAAAGLGHDIEVHGMNLAPRNTGGVGRDTMRARVRGSLKQRLSWMLHEPKELLWNPRYVRAELHRLQRMRPDVLLVRDHLLTASCVPVAQRLGMPLVLEFNAPADESRRYLDEYLHLPAIPEWLERWKLQRADAVTTVSTVLKEHFVQRYGVAAAKITVAPNGADVERFRPDGPVDEVFGPRDAARPVVGYVGSFQKFHGIELLATALRDIGAARPWVQFLLVGDGPERPALAQALAPLGPRVAWTGRVPHDRIPALVRRFDIAIMPESNFYGSPLKVIEWMAAARAVVAVGYGPLAEVIDDGIDGLLFPPRDIAALVAHALRLIDDPVERRELGLAAAARVRRALTWTHNAQRVLHACERARAAHGAVTPSREAARCAAS